ncbi:SDR family NAD(P)-dependent oxidoreductase [Streptomyces sp. SID13031]|uniref:SDR family NAD(P)-dependent oxidoreductase n=1 Tax=Streptomyces sp. SID13031 TaxID=2706046 RepID=UPI0013CA19F8|nr:SDR family NAD(P)-dependent oxidoreductase [Streptomyces sp. SID13031]NEA33381.1 SDR family NAD(P)-dependent oxidoreductase [Streptomyces sp. SID13031]
MSRVLVTGGASGLGAALVARFVADGHQVLSTDVAAESPPPAGAQYRQLNVRDAGDWDKAVAWCEENWGGLDILVNNAGIATGGRIDVESLDEWDRVVDINLMGVVRGCRAFTPMLKRQRSGHIVNTASAAGLVHPPMMSSYNTVKAGVVALSETLSHELHPYGVTVSVVCPSFFKTNLADSLQGDDTEMRATARKLIEKSPRTADEIAGNVIAGIKKQQFLIIPDRPALMAWRTKRFARPLYDRQMRKIAARARDRAESAATKQAAGER